MIILGVILAQTSADTPANCLFEDIAGVWTFSETERNESHSVTCDDLTDIVHTNTFTLEFPNTVHDELGNKGTWTLIYNQGFEVSVLSHF